MDITLGGRYTDFEGRVYSVLNLSGSMVKIGYIDGSTALLPRSEHIRVLREVEQRLAVDRRYNRHVIYVGDHEVDLFTAGFLAVRGFLYARVPPGYESIFVEDHVRMTGHRPDENHYNIVTREDAWQALSTYVEFPYHDDLDFGDLEISEQPNGRWRVRSNRVFWALLLVGFRLGSPSVQDTEKISRGIYQRFGIHGAGDFERGMLAGRTTR